MCNMQIDDRNDDRTAAARAAAARRLAEAGKTSREIGTARRIEALRWLYRWGWSTPTIVDLIAGGSRRGLCTRLEKQGLVKTHPTPSGGGVKGVPASVVVLTADGVTETEAQLADAQILPYPTHPDRTIPWHQLRHDVLVQLWTARRLTENKIDGYVTPREMLGRPSASLAKQPDATWRMGYQAVAVELELTAKRDRELHQAALAIVKAVHPGSERNPKGPFDAVAVLSHSSAILDRYRRLLSPGATITLYQRDKSRHWKPSGQAKVPDWITGRILLQKVELW